MSYNHNQKRAEAPSHCLKCNVAMVGCRTWYTMPESERVGLAKHDGRGLCGKCRRQLKKDGRLADFPRTNDDHRPEPSIVAAVLRDIIFDAPVLPLDVDVPCRDESVEPDWWFSYKDHEVELAKSVCSNGTDGTGCPIKDSCLKNALERNEFWGVWGGEVVRHGRIVLFQRDHNGPAMGIPDKHYPRKVVA